TKSRSLSEQQNMMMAFASMAPLAWSWSWHRQHLYVPYLYPYDLFFKSMELCPARLRFRHCYRDNFDSVCMLVCWTVWKERNARVFDQRSRIPEQLAEAIKEEVLLWKEAGYFETNNR
uniref:Uncharacterized protein n=1 Tax=Oryza glaberrima TaxID=4538 RepID=I1PZT0_ORYGL